MRLLSFLCSIKSVPAVGLLGKFCIQLDCVFILAGGAGKLLTCLELQCCNITLQLSFFRKDLAIVVFRFSPFYAQTNTGCLPTVSPSIEMQI